MALWEYVHTNQSKKVKIRLTVMAPLQLYYRNIHGGFDTDMFCSDEENIKKCFVDKWWNRWGHKKGFTLLLSCITYIAVVENVLSLEVIRGSPHREDFSQNIPLLRH